jgi:hypothetical protein
MLLDGIKQLLPAKSGAYRQTTTPVLWGRPRFRVRERRTPESRVQPVSKGHIGGPGAHSRIPLGGYLATGLGLAVVTAALPLAALGQQITSGDPAVLLPAAVLLLAGLGAMLAAILTLAGSGRSVLSD